MEKILDTLIGYKFDVNEQSSQVGIQLLQLLDIYVISDALKPETCDELIQHYEDQNTQAFQVSNFDEGRTLRITDESLDGKIFNFINQTIQKLSQKLNTNLNVDDSGYNIVKYAIGKGSEKHTDGLFSQVNPKPRVFSVMIFLNNSDIGGDLYFNNKSIFIKPRQSLAVVYPGSFYTHQHRIIPTVTGNVYTLVTWLHTDQLGMPQ